MKVILRDDDRCAIDMLLDRSAIAAGRPSGTSVYAGTQGHLRDRIHAAEKLLCRLDNMVVVEPSPDLVRRTVQYVKHHNHDIATERHLPAIFNNQPPVV